MFLSWYVGNRKEVEARKSGGQSFLELGYRNQREDGVRGEALNRASGEEGSLYCGTFRGRRPARSLRRYQIFHRPGQVPGSRHHPFCPSLLLIGTAHFLMDETSSLVFP
jgi:hypothetical protein